MIGRWLRWALALSVVWGLAAAGSLLWLRANGQVGPLAQLDWGDIWMNGLKWPTIVGLTLLAGVGAWLIDDARAAEQAGRRTQAEAGSRQAAADAARAAANAKHRFAAQVVGLQWLNPLAWKDYPTEWNALWALGLAQPNADDAQVRKDPAKWSKIRPVAGIAFNLTGKQTFDGYYEIYAMSIFGKFWERYFMSPDYFYTVARGATPRRVGSIRVELTLPPGLDAAQSAAFAADELDSYFGLTDPKYAEPGTAPDVRPTQGGAAAGFASLDAALDYLEAHPDKTAWLMAFDAPGFPKSKQLNETGALLILAHPDYATGREPLAFIHRPERVEIGHGQATAAWKRALAGAAARGGEGTKIGYVIHDAGQGEGGGSERLGRIAQAATEALGEGYAFAGQSFNTGVVLGDLRAGTAATELVLAIAYAHHRKVPVAAVTTRAEGEAIAVLVRPSANPTPFDPARKWFRAGGEGNAYLPWWGKRHGASYPSQGLSD